MLGRVYKTIYLPCFTFISEYSDNSLHKMIKEVHFSTIVRSDPFLLSSGGGRGRGFKYVEWRKFTSDTTTLQSHRYGMEGLRPNGRSEKKLFLLYNAALRAVIRGIFSHFGPCREKS
jgi:hypothetical protein